MINLGGAALYFGEALFIIFKYWRCRIGAKQNVEPFSATQKNK